MKKKFLDAAIEIKAVEESGTFEGYASVFGVVDSYNDVVAPGAFKRSLGEWKAKGRMPALLWQHQMDKPIGVYTEMREDKVGLYFKGQLALGTQQGKEAHELLRLKAVTGVSIGYVPTKWEENRDEGITTLTDVDLWESSLVTFPANDEARVAHVKAQIMSGDLPTEREFELFLRDAGFSRGQAKSVIASGYRAFRRDDEPDYSELIAALTRRGKAFQ